MTGNDSSDGRLAQFRDPDAPRWYDVVSVLVLIAGALFVASSTATGAVMFPVAVALFGFAGIVTYHRDRFDARLEVLRS